MTSKTPAAGATEAAQTRRVETFLVKRGPQNTLAGMPNPSGDQSASAHRAPDADLPGIKLTNEKLRVRVVDNAPRYVPVTDIISGGRNGLALVFDRKQHKNIFSDGGLQYVAASARPAGGAGVSPGNAPMRLEAGEGGSAVLSQRGSDATGLDTRIVFTLGPRHVDQTVTFSSPRDIGGFDTFWSSSMNQVQCTSLFLQGVLQGGGPPQWLEVTSAGMGGGGLVYYRPFDPIGKSWAEHVVDNPVLRQKAGADAVSIAATRAAGFVTNEPNKCPFTGFYYGLVDEFVYLMIFREPGFYFWTGCSGATVRNPSWDYGICGGALQAGEERSFHLRLVYKPFAGIQDILAEVQAFRGGLAGTLCGESAPR